MIRRLLWGLLMLLGLTACAAAPPDSTPTTDAAPLDTARPTFTFFYTDN